MLVAKFYRLKYLDLDRFEMASQGASQGFYSCSLLYEPTIALEYEKRGVSDLQRFYDSSIPLIRHPEVRSWAKDLTDERQRTIHGAANKD